MVVNLPERAETGLITGPKQTVRAVHRCNRVNRGVILFHHFNLTKSNAFIVDLLHNYMYLYIQIMDVSVTIDVISRSVKNILKFSK